MASRYEKIWATIKREKEVTIRCRPGKIATIVMAVKKIKSGEQQGRIGLELPRYGKLKIERKITQNSRFGAEIRFELMSAELAENL